MKTFKKNLPKGVKKQFSRYKGVKVRLINKKNVQQYTFEITKQKLILINYI